MIGREARRTKKAFGGCFVGVFLIVCEIKGITMIVAGTPADVRVQLSICADKMQYLGKGRFGSIS